MTRRKLFMFPTVAILLTSIQAVRLYFTQPSPYSFKGIDAVIPGLISFCMIFFFALVVKNNHWRIGVTLAGFAFIARSCITGYPEQKLTFVILTLTLCLLSVIFLSLSWRALGEGFVLEGANERSNSLFKKSIFIILVMTVITGIFLFWGRR